MSPDLADRLFAWVAQRRVAIRFQSRRLARKVGHLRSPIKVVFLAQDSLDWWSMHSLYEACRADRRFDVYVISIGWGPWLGMSSDCAALFEHLHIEAIDGRASPCALADLRPDLLVTSSPYDQYRHPAYHTERLVRSAKVVYIPYGIDLSASNGELAKTWFRQPLHRCAWRIFSGSRARARQWVEHTEVSPHRVVGLGLPVIDQTYALIGRAPPLPSDVLQATTGRFKVLYTPHHTLGGWSTFLEYGPTLRQLICEHEHFYLVFRPHPGLGPTLGSIGAMSQDEFGRYFDIERAYVDSSEAFFGLLQWADVLVSDASSMLFHFAPTGKPIVYLPCEGGAGLDALSQEYVSRACYTVPSEHELACVLVRLSRGIDPLAEARHVANRDTNSIVMTEGAGRRICQYLAATLT
jgi:CDP-Glycerol:Poly(glycerophosphate) glycerophosphotransferase